MSIRRMDRRGMLRLLPAMGGMAFIGEERNPPPGTPYSAETRRFQVKVYGDGDWTSTVVEVCCDRTGIRLPWRVTELSYKVGVGGQAAMQLRYHVGDSERSIELTQTGFILEQTIEGNVV